MYDDGCMQPYVIRSPQTLKQKIKKKKTKRHAKKKERKKLQKSRIICVNYINRHKQKCLMLFFFVVVLVECNFLPKNKTLFCRFENVCVFMVYGMIWT